MLRYVIKTASWAWQERGRMARYFIVGVSAVGVDAGIYWLITRWLYIDFRIANLISTLCGAAYVFLLNKFWSFGERANTARQSRRFTILFIWNYFFQQGALIIFVQYFSAHDIVAKLGVIAILTSWNFLLYRYWIYAAV